MPHSAVHVLNLPAVAANEVVMVGVAAQLVDHGVAGWLGLPQDPLLGESVDDIVDRLNRDFPDLLLHLLLDFLRSEMTGS